MSAKKKWNFSKIAGSVLMLAVITGVLILSVSAIGNQEKERIGNVQITIKGEQDALFVTQNDIMKMLEKSIGKSLKNQPVRSIDLSQLEKQLMKDRWIKEAELFIDNANTLHVNIKENSPVARVFTVNGNSFYVSSTFGILPLNDRVTIRLPVFTGYPDPSKKEKTSDSLLLNQIGTLSSFISKNNFWMSQIDQIDITPSGEFTLIPKLGNQVINFGNADNYQEKFNKLLAFYTQVQTKVGWNYYSAISLQFDGQIVARKRDAALIKTDSIAAIRIMKNLIKEAKEAENDTTMIQLPARESTEIPLPVRTNDNRETDNKPGDVKPEITLKTDVAPESGPATAVEKDKPVLKKNSSEKKVKEKTGKSDKEKKIKEAEKRVPKAVMPSKNNEDEQNN